MAPVKRFDAARPSSATLSPHESKVDSEESFDLNDFDAEMKRLSAANRELLEEFHHTQGNEPAPTDAEEVELLRRENAELRGRVEELEAHASGQGEELWLERQREYEMLLEEKSEVIRSLHQRIQEAQETVAIGDAPPPSPGASSTRIGQAEEILRLKRELEEQRRQLGQDEEDMMAQMRQMEMTMARERAEMARQRQEVQRLQADLAREIEQSSRDPELRERLHSLRRTQEAKQAPAPLPAAAPTAAPSKQQNSSGFFRRMFG